MLKNNFNFLFLIVALSSCSLDNHKSLYDNKSFIEKDYEFLKKNSILDTHINSTGTKTQGRKAIDSIFLVKNIMLSRKKAQPLLDKNLISEYSFYNYILPYKVNYSFKHNWRESSLEFIDESLHDKSEINSISDLLNMCNRINSKIKGYLEFEIDNGVGDILTFNQIKNIKSGSCISLTNFATFITRANGLPTTMDYVPSWANVNGGHAWNALVIDSMIFFPFAGTEANIGEYTPLALIESSVEGYSTKRRPGKIYRRGFIPDTSSVYFKNYEKLKNIGINYSDKDVTALYTKTIDLDIRSLNQDASVRLLNVFSYGRWIPIMAIHANKEVFNDVEINNLYAISSLEKANHLTFVYVNSDGNIQYLDAESKNSMIIYDDKSVEVKQLEYLAKYGWNNYNNIENISLENKTNLRENDEYTLYKWNYSWDEQEKIICIDNKLKLKKQYSDGIYLVLNSQDNPKINAKRPMLFLKEKIIHI